MDATGAFLALISQERKLLKQVVPPEFCLSQEAPWVLSLHEPSLIQKVVETLIEIVQLSFFMFKGFDSIRVIVRNNSFASI